MKTITINELVKIMADKVGADFQTDNFKDFFKFMEDIYTQFGFEYQCYDDMEYYTHEATEGEISVTGETETFKKIYKEFEQEFGSTDSMVYYDMDADEGCKTPEEISNKNMYLHYVNDNCNKISAVVKFFEKASCENNCSFEIVAGNIDKVVAPYCKHDFIWDIKPHKTESHSYLEIFDDNSERLFDSIYWLCQNFMCDSFDEFNKLEVELRYEEK